MYNKDCSISNNIRCHETVSHQTYVGHYPLLNERVEAVLLSKDRYHQKRCPCDKIIVMVYIPSQSAVPSSFNHSGKG